jgi:hemerythrin-like domain-containing protein
MKTQLTTRSKQLSPLSEEHRSGMAFVGQVSNALNNISIERIRNYTRWYWKNHIKPHFFQEEKILLPYFPAGHELSIKLKDDHAYIRDLVLELDHGGEASLFRNLCDLLVTHIVFEEQTLFPWLEQHLSIGQLDTINKELCCHPVGDVKWDDIFWTTE